MRNTTILTTIICLVPVIIGIILYPRLPDTIATHWDMNGDPNGWSPKAVGTIVFPGILVLINILFPLLLKLDPRYTNYDEKVKHLLHWIIPLVCVFCSGTTLSAATGKNPNVPMMTSILLGVVFMAIGNYLPKMAQSYMTGIKLPWTLNSEENWNRTHRLAGFLWVVGGAVMVITGVLGLMKFGIPVVMVLMVLVPTVYSYMLYRKGI